MSDKTKIRAFIYNREDNTLVVLDQTKLPNEKRYVPVKCCQDGYQVIKDMQVRGAPCIAAVGCLSLLIDMNGQYENVSKQDLVEKIHIMRQILIQSRPTAVNLSFALNRLGQLVDSYKDQTDIDADILRTKLTSFCESAINRGLEANERLGDYGSEEFLTVHENKPLTILTHCNTGSLATVGHGTALGVIRTLKKRESLKMVYCTETRPYNQGSRLTAWELVEEKIPATLIADNMVAFLMATKEIDFVVVGADRVAANGDTANKIGTLQIAVTAKHYRVPFYVAAPSQSIDLSTPNGGEIKIEERSPNELRNFMANESQQIQLAPAEVAVWNPCFDITPNELIEGIITEFGVCKPARGVRQFLESEQVQQRRLQTGEALF